MILWKKQSEYPGWQCQELQVRDDELSRNSSTQIHHQIVVSQNIPGTLLLLRPFGFGFFNVLFTGTKWISARFFSGLLQKHPKKKMENSKVCGLLQKHKKKSLPSSPFPFGVEFVWWPCSALLAELGILLPRMSAVAAVEILWKSCAFQKWSNHIPPLDTDNTQVTKK